MKKSRQSRPVSVLDVAAYIQANHLKNQPIAAWKMHKLLYYCQAWSLVFEDVPFFNEKIMLTAKGVIINELCAQHFNQLYVGGDTIGNMNHLSLRQVDTIDYVMKKYGPKTLQELDIIIRSETQQMSLAPYPLPSNEPIEVNIPAMQAYYNKQK
jgi:uncharacterized phage-associated protein